MLQLASLFPNSAIIDDSNQYVAQVDDIQGGAKTGPVSSKNVKFDVLQRLFYPSTPIKVSSPIA